METQPRIVDKPEIILVGMVYYGDPAGNEFGKNWDRFFKYAPLISSRVNEGQSYGLEFYTEDLEKDHKWFYMSAFETSSLDAIPLELVGKRLPACKYAVFTVKGGIKNIGDTFMYAYGTWIPNSAYQVAHRYDFELYEEGRFMGTEAEESEIDLYIPIKEK